MNGNRYAELHAISNFTFLRGASHPEELVERARALGYEALALTDECSMAGAVRAHVKAREVGLKLLIGSELVLSDGPRLVLLAPDMAAYSSLCALVTRGRRRSAKGSYALQREDVSAMARGCLALLLPRATRAGMLDDADTATADAAWIRDSFGDDAWLALEYHGDGLDARRLADYRQLGRQHRLPLVASGNVHLHSSRRRPLQDVLTAIRLGVAVGDAGWSLHPNGEWYLHSLDRLARRFPADLLRETLVVAERCDFGLDQLRYEYPREFVPRGRTPYQHLRRLAVEGLHRRYPGGAPSKVREVVAHELSLIGELRYEAYFLTVHDIVAFARGRGILCQGRGSAANSAVCYCLGITEVDPARMDLLFERFVSRERNEPPDIDVDFEHERREEVIQYIYRKYGREHAALTATVISYRPKSAVRDVGKALGLGPRQVEELSANLSWWDGHGVLPERIREAGFDPDNPVFRQLSWLAGEILGFPRHLSQHTGGFVIGHQPLHTLVPIENAAMAERTVIQWDKDDIDALGLLKVDCLGLGMLSAIRRGLALIEEQTGTRYTLSTIPAEDPDTYEMICQADTMGVFQVESRAQMAMLPRLAPRNFYDLVIEVAIVRPGPIQGDMVHPYLKRRRGLEPVHYPSEAVRQVLERTLGIPIFQEQVIKLAMVAAGFSPGEADGLRRSMAAWRRRGGLEHYHARLIEGMRERGYDAGFAERIYQQILGFGEYGFPESHAASFALLVYVSSWMKRHHPAAFTCALLNSQPMGFYAPSQLVQDAARHGVEIRPVDVNASLRDCTLEDAGPGPALRLGLRLVRHFSREGAERLLAARAEGPFRDGGDLAHRAGLDRGDRDALAAAGALNTISRHRHRAAWELAAAVPELPALRQAWPTEATPLLRPPSPGETVRADYAHTGLTLGPHPLALLRDTLDPMRIRPSSRIDQAAHGTRVRVAGLVTCRQRPGSAGNVVFVTLEDESGYVNLVVWQRVAERYRRALVGARLLGAYGEVQREGRVIHVIARQLRDFSHLLGELATRSRDFR